MLSDGEAPVRETGEYEYLFIAITQIHSDLEW